MKEGHSLVSFVPVQCSSEKRCAWNTLLKTEHCLYVYASSAVLEVTEWVPTTFATFGTDIMVMRLYIVLCTTLAKVEECYTKTVRGQTEWNVLVNCFAILASYCCEVPYWKTWNTKRDFIDETLHSNYVHMERFLSSSMLGETTPAAYS